MTPVVQKLKAAIDELDCVKIEKLLRNGADPNAIIPGEDFAAIHFAAGTKKSIAQLLLHHGADPNLKTNKGSTPLHIAIFWRKSDIVNVLLKYGADDMIRDKENFTAKELAKYYGLSDCLNVLQKWSKKRRRIKLEREMKSGEKGSVVSPAEVKLNVHRGHINIFTDQLDRKSRGLNTDHFHDPDRNRRAPLMSAVFSLLQDADKKSITVTNSEISSMPSSLKMKKHLKAGSIEHDWGNHDTEDFFSADASLDREVDEESVQIEERYPHCSKDLIEPDNRFKDNVQDDHNEFDDPMVYSDTVSTMISTEINDIRMPNHSEETVGIELIHGDDHNCHILEGKNENESVHKEEFQWQEKREEEPRTENRQTNKKPDFAKKHEGKCQKSYDFFCFCNQNLHIQIDLCFVRTKCENQNFCDERCSKIRNRDRSHIFTLQDNMHLEKKIGTKRVSRGKNMAQFDSTCNKINDKTDACTNDGLSNAAVVKADSKCKKCMEKNVSNCNRNAAISGPMGRLTFPEVCVPSMTHGHGMQAMITKQFSTSSQSVRHFSGGNLLQEEKLVSSKANFFADSFSGHKNAMERKTSCYNDESHTSSRTDTLVRGGLNKDKLQMVTTGTRESRKSGNERTTTSKGDKTTQSNEQFQTSTQDEFCFANEIPKEFARIKINDEDFMARPKGNRSGSYPPGSCTPDDAPIPMWGPETMGEYVDGVLSQRRQTFPGESNNDDMRMLEDKMVAMQKDLAEMERHFKESLAADRSLALT